jgi:hypothetical protein
VADGVRFGIEYSGRQKPGSTNQDLVESLLTGVSQSGTSVLHKVQEGGYKSSWIYAKFARGGTVSSLPLQLQIDTLAETLASTFAASSHDDPEDTSTSASGMAVKASAISSANDKKRKLGEMGAAGNVLPWAPPAKRSRAVEGVSNPPAEPHRLPVEVRAEAKVEKETKLRQRRAARKPEKPQETGSQDDDAPRTENSKENCPENQAARRLVRTATKAERKKKKRAARVNQEAEIVHGPLLHRPKDHFATGVDEMELGARCDGKVENVPGAGPINQDPAKREKRRGKRTAQTLANGVVVEEPKADLDGGREGQENPENEKLGDPSHRKPKKYAKAAELRGLSVENYIEKKARKRPRKSKRAASFAGNEGEIENAVNRTVGESDDATANGPDNAAVDFVLDGTGDLDLAEAGFCVDGTGDPDILKKLRLKASRAAKKQLREFKREKRNKIIHLALTEDLGGVYEGSIRRLLD